MRFFRTLKTNLWAILVVVVGSWIPWVVSFIAKDAFKQAIKALAARSSVSEGAYQILSLAAYYPVSACLLVSTLVICGAAIYSAVEVKRRINAPAQVTTQPEHRATAEVKVSNLKPARPACRECWVLERMPLKGGGVTETTGSVSGAMPASIFSITGSGAVRARIIYTREISVQGCWMEHTWNRTFCKPAVNANLVLLAVRPNGQCVVYDDPRDNSYQWDEPIKPRFLPLDCMPIDVCIETSIDDAEGPQFKLFLSLEGGHPKAQLLDRSKAQAKKSQLREILFRKSAKHDT